MTTIKAISINQPFASLILNPPHEKRVENRTWKTDYTGDVLIHAGKSDRWLKTWREPLPDPMPMGAIVGVIRLVGCVHIEAIQSVALPDVIAWLSNHKHASGPWCWVLDDFRRFQEPVPYLGCLGLFDVQRSVVERQLQHSGATT